MTADGLVINNRYCSLTIHNKNEAALAAVFIRSWGKNVKVHFEGEKELIITAKVIPNLEEIQKEHDGELTDDIIHDIIWEKIKEVNHKLTSYKAIKKLEIKKDEFAKTTTMKIKRYVEINKGK